MKRLDDENGLVGKTKAAVKSELTALLKPLIRPVSYFHLKEIKAPEDQAMRSHFGGLPYLEEGDEWPCDTGGKPFEFVFQVFQDKAGRIALPSNVRLVQYFESDDECYCAVFASITGKPAALRPPKKALIHPYQSIKFTHALMLPELYFGYDRISRRTALQWGEDAAASEASDLFKFCPQAEALFKKLKPGDLWWEQDLKMLDLGAPGPKLADYLGGYPCTVPDNQSKEGNGFPGPGWQHLFQFVREDSAENSFAEHVYYEPESGETRYAEQEPEHIYDEDGYVSTDEGF
jgi:hypothetical protein